MNDAAWYALGAIAATLTSLGFVPQIVKMRRTKSVRDVSPFALLQLIVGVLLWIVYGVHLKDPVVIFANVVAFSTLAITLTLYLLYFKKP